MAKRSNSRRASSRAHAPNPAAPTAAGGETAAGASLVERLESRTLFAGAPAELLYTLPSTSANVNVTFDQATEVGGKLFLTGHRDQEPESLYVTGTGSPLFTAVTSSGTPNTGITAPTAFGGAYYFFANATVNGHASDGLFASDGTPAGTRLVKEIRAGNTNTLPAATFELGGRLYFFWPDATRSTLWSTDGTTAGTAPVWTAPVLAYALSVSRPVDGQVYFGTAGKMWRTDGTAGGTTTVWTLPDANDYPATYTVAGSKLFLTTAAAPQTLYSANRDASGIAWVQLPPGNGLILPPVPVGDRVVVPGIYAADGSPRPAASSGWPGRRRHRTGTSSARRGPPGPGRPRSSSGSPRAGRAPACG